MKQDKVTQAASNFKLTYKTVLKKNISDFGIWTKVNQFLKLLPHFVFVFYRDT